MNGLGGWGGVKEGWVGKGRLWGGGEGERELKEVGRRGVIGELREVGGGGRGLREVGRKGIIGGLREVGGGVEGSWEEGGYWRVAGKRRRAWKMVCDLEPGVKVSLVVMVLRTNSTSFFLFF